MSGSQPRHKRGDSLKSHPSAGGSPSVSGSRSGIPGSPIVKSPSSRSPPTESPGPKSPTGSRNDGNRDPNLPRTGSGSMEITKAIKNMDMGHDVYAMVRGHKVDLAKRPPKASTLGREIQMGLNIFPLTFNPNIKVFQYQVIIGSTDDKEKRGLVKKLWHSKAVQEKLPHAKTWVFDGMSLAWSIDEISEIRVQVDLDAEQGRTPGKRPNIHRIMIRPTSNINIDFASLTSYLDRRADFNNACLEAVTFLDHLMREWPSQNYTSIKRSFFAKGRKRFELGGGIEAFKGVYQSIRIGHGLKGAQLNVNLDVANGTFYISGLLSLVLVRTLNLRSEAEIGLLIKGDNVIRHKFFEAKRLRKLHVYAVHRRKDVPDRYVIDRILPHSAAEYQIDIKGAKQTVQAYFMSTGLRLVHPEWPVVQMTKKAVVPLELLMLEENQRYPFKLDDRQTASMIKVAVTEPKLRWEDIEHGLDMVNWAQDPYLKSYGMKIDAKQTVVKARLLDNPIVQFSKDKTDPRTSGRWDLKGKKFIAANPAPLKSWGVCVVQGRFPPKKEDVDRFIAAFVAAYKGHGGRVDSSVPAMFVANHGDIKKMVGETWQATGNRFQLRPQILCFILPDKDSLTYGRIKHHCECTLGVVSQCMQMSNVQKCQPQYISNVLMKFNAKLGGNTQLATNKKGGSAFSKISGHTVIIGADVSHAAPGSPNDSIAAMTVSMDRTATRYAAICESNDQRVEMIKPSNIQLLKPLLQTWVHTTGQGKFPTNIIYFRDGVSEGQFAQVIEQEVNELKGMLRGVSPTFTPKFIVIIASKRHHVRFFPKTGAGDRNGNPLPGTLVETGVTHPFENDFYICSHAAIKGTARPVHYNVLLNEAAMSNNDLQTLIYEHCYQYIRSTTPVSLFPAVYYAHLVSNRAMHHDMEVFGDRDDLAALRKHEELMGVQLRAKGAAPPMPAKSEATSSGYPKVFGGKLKEYPKNSDILRSMWYI